MVCSSAVWVWSAKRWEYFAGLLPLKTWTSGKHLQAEGSEPFSLSGSDPTGKRFAPFGRPGLRFVHNLFIHAFVMVRLSTLFTKIGNYDTLKMHWDNSDDIDKIISAINPCCDYFPKFPKKRNRCSLEKWLTFWEECGTIEAEKRTFVCWRRKRWKEKKN